MEFGGTVPIDAPDPGTASDIRLRAIPFPVFQLRPQRSLTRVPMTGFTEMGGPNGADEVSVQFTYTLWRYPDDRSDPRNEIEVDERTRRAIEGDPPGGRPAWLKEQARIFLYPMLWEATRTTWHASPDRDRHSLAQQLLDHTNHFLRNSFREELGLPAGPTTADAWKVKASAVADSSISVDGEERPGVHIDTDPFVYAVGVRVNEHVVCTTVLPRDSLPFLTLSLARIES
ncbi:hypothetical protein [Microbacterium sp. 5K110]|jgi:hypothetical protein|uniref:hypothetical protein n=1 Tax=unclassified Microbacterium TaxID=2609290 RepID=UPI0010FEA2BF|nr:hypothetical protein [Microbacterium sp. 5K110]TLF34238.1 hypothetical protein FE256_01650 [Microbacterium sp. 5K110]